MALLQFWKNAKDDVLKLTIEQVVSNAGDGNLHDHSPCCGEFRQFLNVAPIERLFDYARHCLENSFNKSGLVLQDIVNEFGRRLDFEVEDGLYQGTKKAIGYDGIWRAKGEPALVIEVKTTDYVTVRLEKLAEYKEKLLAENKVGKDASILIVVGREDTGALEAQVRGSRYAWDMRLISIERLIKLVQVRVPEFCRAILDGFYGLRRFHTTVRLTASLCPEFSQYPPRRHELLTKRDGKSLTDKDGPIQLMVPVKRRRTRTGGIR